MHIAICDDDPCELVRITDILEFYRQKKNVSFTYRTFTEALSLLDEARRSPFDLILLDVLMPLFNGMEAAHEIRSFDTAVKIIFLSSSREFAMESYAVKAYTYLLKPSTKEGFIHILDELFQHQKISEEGLLIKFKNGTSFILFSQILYVEVQSKKLFFHLNDGTIREIIAPLHEFEDKLLSRCEFVKVHRSIIANLAHAQELIPEQIRTHDGNIIPVSRRLYPLVKDAYMKYLFLKKGVK